MLVLKSLSKNQIDPRNVSIEILITPQDVSKLVSDKSSDVHEFVCTHEGQNWASTLSCEIIGFG